MTEKQLQCLKKGWEAKKALKKLRIIKICAREGCNNTFSVPKCLDIVKYCSRSCGAKGKRPWRLGVHLKSISGKNHPNWKGGLTSKNRIQRIRFKQVFQKEVFDRDNYTCQICGIRGVDLQVDHIQEWSKYVEGRFDLNNCRTLCAKCHYQITFGKPMPESVKGWGHNILKGGAFI